MYNDRQTDYNIVSNFSFLEAENPILAELGCRAEENLDSDPVTSIEKIGQFGEFLARQIAQNYKVDLKYLEKQYDLVNRLKNDGLVDLKIYNIFDSIRLKRNDAVHYRIGDYQTALTCLRAAYDLGFWYYHYFGNNINQLNFSFVIPSSVNKQLFAQNQNFIDRLIVEIKNYELICEGSKNSPSTLADLQHKQNKIYARIVVIKNKLQSEAKKQANKKNQLELEQIKIDMDISDLQNFECNYEIRIMLQGLYERKARLNQELVKIEQNNLNTNNQSNSANKYNSAEKAILAELLNTYDGIKLQIDKLSQPEYWEDRIKQKQQEIIFILDNISSIQQKASELNVVLSPIPYSVIQSVDKYNLYRFRNMKGRATA